jgi:hypothetical protein
MPILLHHKFTHINDFRTESFRVFLASPYFNVSLEDEIKWNREHLKKLHQLRAKPHLFHSERPGELTEHKHRHFQEHVIDAIPFHEKLLSEHMQRLETIRQLIPITTYKKLVDISMKHGGTPEYFVYNKPNKDFFFVAEHLTDERRTWIRLVRDKHKLCDVVILKI